MIVLLVNGRLVADRTHAIDAQDRGLQYGDGVFETMLLRDGEVCLLANHLARLQVGCGRLGISAPTYEVIQGDIEQLVRIALNGVIKLIVTRGAGGRGYRAAANLPPNRMTSLHGMPLTDGAQGVTIRWCQTRLARNAQLAGIKHLNRLEQVLAQNEWHDEHIAEGLMLDTEDEVICATAANVFLVSEGTLVTPDLRFGGIRGVMREQVLLKARSLNIDVQERAVRAKEVLAASELFLTSTVRGVRSVVRLDDRTWPIGPIAARLAAALSR